MPRAAKSSSATTGRADWKPAASAALVNALRDEKDHGRMSDTGFKPSSWQAVANAVKAAVAMSVTTTQCKNHWQGVCFHLYLRFFAS